MKGSRTGVAVLLGVVALTGCGARAAAPAPTVVQPGAPGEPARAAGTGAGLQAGQRGYHAADVRFMQGMIPHHAQALVMTALVPERTRRDDIRRLARRIELSQKEEITLMQRWLAERGETVPAVDGPGDHAGHTGHHHHAHHGHGDAHAGMPGMLTAAEMEQLASASGDRFDRLFLEFMIRHHEGALVMVAELFESGGAGEDGEIFQFASHVDGDQRIEIARMQRMLSALPR